MPKKAATKPPAHLREVVKLRKKGFRNAQIATRMGMTEPKLAVLIKKWAPELLARAQDEPTPGEMRVYRALYELTKGQGAAPTMRDVLDRIGARGTNHAAQCYDALERKGYIERDRGRPRAVRCLVDLPEEAPSARSEP